MPLPKVKDSESKNAFLSRCMDDEIATKEFPDEDQRYAVCQDIWKKSKEAKSMGQEIERRYFPVSEIRLQKTDEGKPKLTGYAAVFNSLSEDLGGFREKIKRGAFKEHMENADVRALWNHDPNYVLGRTKSGTLDLKEDRNGLRMDVSPPDAQWANDLIQTIERGDVDQMSFGFQTVTDSWEQKEGEAIRTLEEVKLMDVSPVTFPAYTETSVALRSMQAWDEQRNTENDEPPADAEEQEGSDVPTHKLNILKRKLELKAKQYNIKEGIENV